MNLKKNKKGFTLVELIVVLVIIGILLAMVIPNLTGYIDRAQMKNNETEARSVYMAAMAIAAEEYAAGNRVATALESASLSDLAPAADGATIDDLEVQNGALTKEFSYTGVGSKFTTKVATNGTMQTDPVA